MTFAPRLGRLIARIAGALFGLFCFCVAIAGAQTPPEAPKEAPKQAAKPAHPDSALTAPAQPPREKVFAPLDEIAPPLTQTAASLAPKKNPLVALACSIIPGGGQIYVGSYWKAALAIGGAAILYYQVGRFQSLFNQSAAAYDAILLDSVPTSQSQQTRQQQNALYVREFYRDARDTYAVYLLGVYVLAAVDAYVGAHLYEFDVSDDLKASVGISPLQGRLNLALRW